jgi:hypothetical protein
MRRAIILALLAVTSIASLAAADMSQVGPIRIKLDGGISPKRLPREHSAPVSVSVSTAISATPGHDQPQLTKLQIEINRFGHLDATGLPVCEIDDIQPATTQNALRACRGSLVGEGTFSAQVALDQQPTFPSNAKMYAFSGRYKGKPAILAHVYGEEPVPTSFTLPFLISKRGGSFGTVLSATIPKRRGNSVTALSLKLSRGYSYRGKRRSYATASCPAPKGISVAPFKFARVSYSFADGHRTSSVLSRSCHPR